MVLLVGCIFSRDTKLLEPKRLTGLNGPSLYFISDKDNRVFKVLKEEYSENYLYNIFLERDTIELGQSLHAEVVVVRPIYTITLHSPEIFQETVTNRLIYSFTPKSLGINEFRGAVEFDSTQISFEYKFIVIPKK